MNSSCNGGYPHELTPSPMVWVISAPATTELLLNYREDLTVGCV
jgi:hypothetical protein